jgi:large subunit ribosomal protein L17
MRHRIDKKSFNRDTKARASLILAVSLGLLEHGEVITTKAKGRQAARLVESCITIAKKGNLAARRQLHRVFGKTQVVNNLCDRVAPVFTSRTSGFTRLTPLGNRRGDNALMYRLALTEVLPPPKKKQIATTKLTTKTPPIKKKPGIFGQLGQDNKSTQDAIRLEQHKDEKLKTPVLTKNQRRTTTRTSVTGGGRGK